MRTTVELLEDNAGGLHLAALDAQGTCLELWHGLEWTPPDGAHEDMRALGGRITDDWEGPQLRRAQDPAAGYRELQGGARCVARMLPGELALDVFDPLGAAARRYLGSAAVLEWSECEYQQDRTKHEALEVTWEAVEALLGRPHEGSPEDDERLVAALLRSGAPAWVRDASGWIEPELWGVIGPELPEAEDGLEAAP